MSIALTLYTNEQRRIADALWAAESLEQVDQIIRQYGAMALTIKELMLAAAFDDISDLEQAQDLLEQFR